MYNIVPPFPETFNVKSTVLLGQIFANGVFIPGVAGELFIVTTKLFSTSAQEPVPALKT
jgi:hypothetical protein